MDIGIYSYIHDESSGRETRRARLALPRRSRAALVSGDVQRETVPSLFQRLAARKYSRYRGTATKRRQHSLEFDWRFLRVLGNFWGIRLPPTEKNAKPIIALERDWISGVHFYHDRLTLISV